MARYRSIKARLTIEELRRKDAELAKIARMKPAMLVCIAMCLAIIREKKWNWDMGVARFGDFVRQWCRQSASWGDQLALFGRRLRDLPLLKDAILRGVVPISQAMKLAGVIDEEDQDVWLEEMRGRSATGIGEMLRVEAEVGEKDEESDAEEDDYVTWSCKASPMQMAWMRAAFMMIDSVAESRLSRDNLAEYTIAEVFTTLLLAVPEEGGFDKQRQAAISEARRLNRVARYEAERRADPSLPKPERIEPVEIRVPSDMRGVVKLLQVMCQRLDGLDLEVGLLADQIWRNDGWRRLNYASEQQYCEHRIGMSLRTLRGKRALARKCRKLVPVARALNAGKIGYLQASLICRVATRSTAKAWVARARNRTVKHLQQEVEAAEACGTRRPPTKSQLAAVVGLEQTVNGLPIPDARPMRQLSASAYAPNGVFEWRMRRSQRDRVHMLMQMYEKWGSPYGAFLDFVPLAVFASQVPDPERIKSELFEIGQRDLGCTNPVCTDRDCSAHHIRFRSKGGTDDEWNLTGIDPICHLELVHKLRSLRVSGRAPGELTWELGPTDIGLKVVGRKLVRMKRAA